ncbi:unnamed protein product, partial [marine sediment metagenome]
GREGILMKILHIWSCAGVSCLIAKYMDSRHDTQSDVIITEKWDKIGLNDYRTTKIKSKPIFGLKGLTMARGYDLIHVHYHSIFIPFLKTLYDKPVIMHFHGSDVRENWEARLKRIKKADKILVSTPDLLTGAPLETSWIPNPVDTVKFEPMKCATYVDRALTTSYGADEEAQAIADNYGLRLDFIRDRIQHKRVPLLMSKYKFYIDVKRDFRDRLLYEGSTLSKTGLEALAMGLKVVSKDLSIREGLPEIHQPENVADSLFTIYEKLMENTNEIDSRFNAN